MKKVLITGITGQDGSYLAEFLLERDTKSMALSAGLLYPIQGGLTTCCGNMPLHFTMEICQILPL